jgi:hypothetical protein
MNYQEWKKQIKPDKKLRKYQHIDEPINLDDEKSFQKVIRVIEDIKNHQFLPFIKKIENKIRFRRNAEGKAARKNKPRPIMYASHIDAHIYSYYNFLLMQRYENYLEKINLSKNVIAYRKIKIEGSEKGKSNVHFAKEVFDYIQGQNNCVVITQDITSFFDNLNHKLLKEKICKINGTDKLDEKIYKIFRSLTAYKYINYDDFINKKIKKKTKNNKYAIYKILDGVVNENRTNIGIPQGSPISGLLANIYLIDFDNQINTSFPDVYYRRYSDDLIFVCKNEQKENLLKFIEERIKEYLLEINPAKSFISYFKKEGNILTCNQVTDGLGNKIGRNYVDYLGLEFSGENIYLRKNTVQKLKIKQEKKVLRQLSNTIKQERRKPRKIKIKINRSNYFKRASDIINNIGIKKQVLRITKSRNKIRLGKKAITNKK